MKIFFGLAMLLVAAQSIAATPQSTITATGTMYFELDMLSKGGVGADGVNFAFFVPDAASSINSRQ
ncbi:MAG: hypothetical protein V4567_15155 [Pseudomonadota bacterium]